MRRNSTREQMCKKHPSHKQSRGVCPFCLRERLSQLSSSSSSSSTINHSDSSTGSSLSPYSSDSDLSSAGSPVRKSFYFLSKGESSSKALKKSLSLAFVVEEKERKKKKGRFWSNLLGGRKEEDEMKDGRMLHSKTVREKSHTKWNLFS